MLRSYKNIISVIIVAVNICGIITPFINQQTGPQISAKIYLFEYYFTNKSNDIKSQKAEKCNGFVKVKDKFSFSLFLLKKNKIYQKWNLLRLGNASG